MSRLFDREVNAEKESLKKNFRGLCKLPHAHETVCNKNERNKQRNKKKDSCVEMFLMEGGHL